MQRMSYFPFLRKSSIAMIVMRIKFNIDYGPGLYDYGTAFKTLVF